MRVWVHMCELYVLCVCMPGITQVLKCFRVDCPHQLWDGLDPRVLDRNAEAVKGSVETVVKSPPETLAEDLRSALWTTYGHLWYGALPAVSH